VPECLSIIAAALDVLPSGSVRPRRLAHAGSVGKGGGGTVPAEGGREADAFVARGIAVLTAGTVLGVIEVVVATSFAALIFAGDLSIHMPAAIGLTLVSAAVILTLTAMLSTLPGMVASVQDISAAVLALIAAAIAARLGPEAPETFLTVVLAIGLTTALAGVFFLVLGTLHLGDLIRYVPYPVVGGFLGGTGWLLVQGSFGVLTDLPLRLSTLPALAEPASVARWLPGVVFALVLLALIRRYGHFLIIPIGLAASVVLFYAVLLLAGHSVAEAEAGGWLLGPFPEGGLWQPWMPRALTSGSWTTVTAELGNIAILMLFAALGLLLNAGGIELAAKRELDLDRELRAAGVANLITGFAGGIPGYHALSLTGLAHQMRGTSRAVGCVAGVVCVAALLFGAATLSLFPRIAVGGLLLLVGLAFLMDWVYDARHRLPRSEYAVLLLIVVLIAAWGFMQGVVVGLAAAIVLFIVNYSRLDVVKHSLSGDSYQSNVDRRTDLRAALRARGGHVHILELEGFLFFGTANRLVERIRARERAPDLPALRFLVLDFRRVTGLDSSTVSSFTKISSLAEAEGFALVLTALDDRARRLLAQAGLSPSDRPELRLFHDLDHGVQWCEEQLLADIPDPSADTPVSVADWLGADHAGALLRHLERLDVPEGHVLIRQDDRAGGLYFLASGRLTVELARDGGAPVRLRALGPGTVTGELALYLGVPRTATVVADASCRVYRLSPEAFETIERTDPELAAALHRWLAGVLAGRLADSLRTIQALLE
jgi:sulfate permease, SulP family